MRDSALQETFSNWAEWEDWNTKDKHWAVDAVCMHAAFVFQVRIVIVRVDAEFNVDVQTYAPPQGGTSIYLLNEGNSHYSPFVSPPEHIENILAQNSWLGHEPECVVFSHEANPQQIAFNGTRIQVELDDDASMESKSETCEEIL